MSMRPPHMQHSMSDPSVALRKAARDGKLVRLTWLAKTGGGIAFCNNLNVPILIDTINAGQPRAAKILMDSGINIHCITQQGLTPLMAAAANGEVGLIRSLIKAGARINDTDIKRKTALHHAAEAGKAKAYETLMRLGADDALLDLAGLTAQDSAAPEVRAWLQAGVSLSHGQRIKALRLRKPAKGA